jgi:hypothetical protein
VCRIVSRRSGSSLRFHGSWSDRYRFAAVTTRIASPAACLNRFRASSPPTVSNPAREYASSSASACCGAVGVGTAPTFLWAIEMDRLTRLPHSLASSKFTRRTNSSQVKSTSWFSGPATAMW